MNCAKVLFSFLEKNIKYKNSSLIGKCLKVVGFSHKSIKVKPFCTNIGMEDLFDIPKHLKGMKKLDKNVFNKTVTVPCLVVPVSNAETLLKTFKKYLFKLLHFKPVQSIDNDKIKILLDPKKIKSWNDINESMKQSLISENVSEDCFSTTSVQITYDNWPTEALLKAVIPEDMEPLRAYSIIGHIIHLNIKDHLLDYRHVIGQILLDKNHLAKTIVYKKHFIDNVYRNFEMEIICGEPNFLVSVKQNECQFEFDFSKVYWNPRLGCEYLRILELLKERDVLFDVFAGVGPFSIPAAKKKCRVFANDLNPDAIKWLKHNVDLNKKAKAYIEIFNKDGKDFILEDFKKNIIKIWEDVDFNNSIHIVMNLPMIAPTFIKYFNKLITKSDLVNVDVENVKKCLPIIHCYFFVHQEDKKTCFEKLSQLKLDNTEHSFHFIRFVSGSTEMYRVTFTLPFEYLVEEYDIDKVEPLPKRICLE